MIKKTLYFNNPTYLSIRLSQLEIKEPKTRLILAKIPIEDIGIVCLDNPQITITQQVINQLLINNAAIINCDEKHLPNGLFLPLNKNHVQSERFKIQINASLPLRKQLWLQNIKAKINNQSELLKIYGINEKPVSHLITRVKSGDPDNIEGQAAKKYWERLLSDFKRFRFGEPPNNLLNFGYAILRSIVARALVSTGLLPTIGIHHRNKYNAYCLADDMMEAYRPFVDMLVMQIIESFEHLDELTKEIKKKLLEIATVDVEIDGKRSPLMIAISRTTNSLFECFDGTKKKLLLPKFPNNA